MGGRGGGGYITNTHTGYITFWRQWRSAGKSRTSRQLSFPFLALILLSLVYLNDFNPSLSAPVRGCTLEREKRRVVSRLVSSECLKNLFEFELHISFLRQTVFCVFSFADFSWLPFQAKGTPKLLHRTSEELFFSHFQKQKNWTFWVDSKNKSDEILSRGFSISFFFLSFSFFSFTFIFPHDIQAHAGLPFRAVSSQLFQS